MSRTFTNLQADVLNRLQDTGDVRWSVQEKKDALNIAYRDWCAHTGMVRDFVTFAQDGSSTSVYKQPSGTRIVRVLLLQTGQQELAHRTPQQLFRWSSTWDTASGTPLFYVWPYQMASGVTKLRVVPDSGEALTDLKGYCEVLPADLSAGSDVPAIPEQYHDALVDKAVAYLLKKNGVAQDIERAQVFEQAYLAQRDEARIRTSEEFDGSERTLHIEWF